MLNLDGIFFGICGLGVIFWWLGYLYEGYFWKCFLIFNWLGCKISGGRGKGLGFNGYFLESRMDLFWNWGCYLWEERI